MLINKILRPTVGRGPNMTSLNPKNMAPSHAEVNIFLNTAKMTFNEISKIPETLTFLVTGTLLNVSGIISG